PGIKQQLLTTAMERFFELRETPALKKKPSTSEFIDWLRLLLADDVAQEVLQNTQSGVMPLYGALIKNEQDVQLVERLAFIERRR
ncbi:MAG: ATP-binding protein, partial [Gammaproteobacteria bacterium]|nr:ATP-binding protein [Gammaproteobacteria bacterium]